MTDKKKQTQGEPVQLKPNNTNIYIGLAVAALIGVGIVSFVSINKPKKDVSTDSIQQETLSTKETPSQQDTSSAKIQETSTQQNTSFDNKTEPAPAPSSAPTSGGGGGGYIAQPNSALVAPSRSPVRAVVPVASPMLLAKNLRPLTAQSLAGPKPTIIPRIAREVANSKIERNTTDKQLSTLPSEIANEKPETVGQAALPDGSTIYVVYNDKGKPVKVLEITPDGKKIIKTIDENGKVDSIVSNGKKLTLEFKEQGDSKTEVVYKDSLGNIVEKRFYNSQGLLVQLIDSTGKTTNYTYTFDNGAPVTYSEINPKTGDVKAGKFADVEDLQMSKILFTTEPNVKSVTYERDDKGLIKKIVENKGQDNEIVKEINYNQQIQSIEHKKIKTKYLYNYDKNGNIISITIVSPDGSKKTIKKGDPEFSMLESESEDFNPIDFGQSIQEQQNMLKYTDQNQTNKLMMDNLRYKNLPSAGELRGIQAPVSPQAQGINPSRPQQPVSAPKAPASAPAGMPRR